MAWADIPLTDHIRASVAREFRIETDGDAERLHGGEESASYRVGDNVIRIGPDWRDTPELEWCYALAAHAARSVPEVPNPRTNTRGHHTIRADGRPVSVWPFVEGVWASSANRSHRDQAAELLARLHRALASVSVEQRPVDTSPRLPTPDLDDAELDEWWSDFLATSRPHQALHGDYYRGNILVDDGRFKGLLDWDNAFVGPPAQEVAWASWEWTPASDEFDLEYCHEFLAAYVAAGGPAPAVDEKTIAQVVRHRVRWEVAYGRAMRLRGVEHDEDDLEYEADLIEAFHELRADYV